MSRFKVIVKGLSWVFIQNIINVAYSLLAVPFLVSYFGKEEYGLIGIANSVNIYTQFLEMGFALANVKLFSEYIQNRDLNKLQRFWGLSNFIYHVIGIINTLIIFGVACFSSYLFNITSEQESTLRNLLLILAANSFFSWISVCFDQLLKAEDQIDWIARRKSVLKMLQFVILAAVIYFKLSIETYFFFYIFMATLILPFSITRIKKLEPDLRLKPCFDGEMFRVVIPYFLSFFSFGIFQFIANSSRPIILGNISGPGPVAEFTVMSTIASAITLFSGTFTQVLLPIVSKMNASGDNVGLYKVVNQGSKYANILLTTIVFTLVISCKELVQLYVGPSFINVVKWLSIWLIMLLLSHRNVMTSLVFSQKNLRPVTIMSGFAMTCALVIYFILIPTLGIGGAVIGYLVHELIHTLFYYVYYFPKYMHMNTYKIFIQSILPTWGVASLVALIIYVIFHMSFGYYSDIISIIFKSALFIGIFLFSVWNVLLSKDDKSYLISIIKR